MTIADEFISNLLRLDTSFEQYLAFGIEFTGAQAGLCYQIDPINNSVKLVGIQHANIEDMIMETVPTGLARAAFERREPLIAMHEQGTKELRDLELWLDMPVENVISIPAVKNNRAYAVLQFINYIDMKLSLLQSLGERLGEDLALRQELAFNQLWSDRLQQLLGYLGGISSSLDPDQILRMMLENVSMLLDAEARSLFLLDEPSGDAVLHISSRVDHRVVENYRIPNGKGIISHVITTGKPIVVNDVKHDRRHFEGLDAITNFDTRSVLAVALRTHSINLGDSRGQSDERIIGGLEVLNKKNGHFDDMDLSLMEIFSNQAATILQTACLYDQADQLFLDVLQALMEAVDSKDPYTQGHSRRVSDFSVAIADELGVDGKTIHQIRIGSMLHDVGKIGIPDHILNKPGTLTRKEYLEISRHPMIGERIMKRVHLLSNELSAVIEHHERLDGSGYPLGLRGSEISLIGRIVAVADVFDALTSNRPYRAKLSVEESFQRLFDEADTRFDRKVVEALASAYKKGMIKI